MSNEQQQMPIPSLMPQLSSFINILVEQLPAVETIYMDNFVIEDCAYNVHMTKVVVKPITEGQESEPASSVPEATPTNTSQGRPNMQELRLTFGNTTPTKQPRTRKRTSVSEDGPEKKSTKEVGTQTHAAPAAAREPKLYTIKFGSVNVSRAKFLCVVSGDCAISFGGQSTVPCAVATLESIGHLGLEENKVIGAEVTTFIEKELGVAPENFFLSFYDLKGQDIVKGGVSLA